MHRVLNFTISAESKQDQIPYRTPGSAISCTWQLVLLFVLVSVPYTQIPTRNPLGYIINICISLTVNLLSSSYCFLWITINKMILKQTDIYFVHSRIKCSTKDYYTNTRSFMYLPLNKLQINIVINIFKRIRLLKVNNCEMHCLCIYVYISLFTVFYTLFLVLSSQCQSHLVTYFDKAKIALSYRGMSTDLRNQIAAHALQ